MKFKTPILFIIYNKPEETAKVFSVIKQLQPSKLYIAGDGPRVNASSVDMMKIEEARKVIKQVTWKCELKTLLRSDNRGCKYSVSEAITWFFKNEPEGIILEDDCVPEITFFYYCQELLYKYRHNEKISVIAGSNTVKIDNNNNNDSYLFSIHNRIWGWATWKRVWNKYDVNMKDWDKINKLHQFREHFSSERSYQYWKDIFERCHKNMIDTWDYQLFYLQLKNQSLTVIPTTNLISNIGFGSSATHTKYDIHNISNFPTHPISFPLKHPSTLLPNVDYDTALENQLINNNYVFVLKSFIVYLYSIIVKYLYSYK